MEIAQRQSIATGVQHARMPSPEKRAMRLPVKLEIAIGMKNHACITQSVNVSNTGVLVDNYEGPRLKTGDKVSVLIKGVLPNNNDREQLNKMYVAWAVGSQVALTFDSELITH